MLVQLPAAGLIQTIQVVLCGVSPLFVARDDTDRSRSNRDYERPTVLQYYRSSIKLVIKMELYYFTKQLHMTGLELYNVIGP